MTQHREAPGQAENIDEPRELFFGSADEFFREYLRLVYRRRVGRGEYRWAGRWWQYPEALIRIEALWRAWEHLRLDGAVGMSTWWRDHADHHMPILLATNGPFANATEGEENTNGPGEPLPHVPAPEGLFSDHRKQPDTEERGTDGL